MSKVNTSAHIPVSAEKIWELIGQFNGLPGWHPAAESSELEDGGQQRRIQIAGGGGQIVEKLLKLDDNNYEYTVQFASSAATISFRAKLDLVQYADHFAVAYDYATSDKVILEDHKYIRFFLKMDDGHSRVIAIDQKAIGDQGNHIISYTNLNDVLLQRMRKDHENSKID